MTTEENLWFVPEYLCHIAHTPLLTDQQEARLSRLDKRSHAAGLVGHSKHL
ncbi:MAG: hypothetical protein ACE14L_07105 [Terriglobales bacterium]